METLLGYVVLVAVAMARPTAAIAVLPIFTRLGLTGMLRTAVAFALALPIIPHMTADFASVIAVGGPTLVAIIAKETVIGLLLGIAFGVPFWAAQSAGDVIDTQRGASIAYMTDPTALAEVSITGTFLELTMLALFFVGGGPNLVIGALYDSLQFWPIMALFPKFQGDTAGLLLGVLDNVLRGAVLIGGPIVIVLFVVEAAMALVSRISPQLPMSDLSLPIKAIAVFTVLPIYLVFFLAQSKRMLGGLGGILPELERFLK
jgi:type III secretion protein T